MLHQKIAATFALATALTFTAQSQAAEVSLNTFVGALLSNAVSVAQQEIQYSVQESVLNAAHSLSLDGEQAPAAKVSIKELAKSENQESEAEEVKA